MQRAGLAMQGVADPEDAAEPRARILLVDDDERNLLALAEVLEPLGEIVRVTSGKHALRELLRHEFAVILLDVFMPEMDGYETAALIRQRPQTAHTPIIFLSAVNKETEHLMRGYAMGAVDYVFKPVEPLVLKSKVSVFVDLFLLRQQISSQARAEQELREAKLQAEAERLAFERELQQTRLRQAAILDALPLALYEATLDEDGRLARRFVGGDIGRLAGPDAAALSSGELRWEDRIAAADAASLERRLAQGADGTVSTHYRWQRDNGEVIHLMDHCVPGGAGDRRFVGTIVDVTAQRELEQQLVQARKMEALGQLTGGVAHDFNNLLAAVLGGLHLLHTRIELGPREGQIVEQMRHAAEKGVELVRRLMAFARKQELTPAVLEPRALADSVGNLIEHALGDGRVAVEWRLPEEPVAFFVDPAQLELALVNLLINARDAMPDGGQISVAIEPVPAAERPARTRAGGGFLRITVADEGQGIPAELIEKVTEPFFTTKEAGKGTGLGLSMVAGFVAQSGGEFRIASAPAKGTQVTLVLPAAPSKPSGEATSAADAPQEVTVRSVLVVDDDESVRLIMAEQLRQLGVEVTVACHAEEALAVLEKAGEGIQFVLTDLSMTGLDGREMLTLARRKWPHLKGAIMTGNPRESASGAAAGGMPLLQKPIDQAQLIRLLAIP